MTWALTLGDFHFTPGVHQFDLVEVRVHGLRRGKPSPVVSTMSTLLQDGAFERIDSHGNRDQQVIVGFKGTDPIALAEAEGTLFREVGKGRNELSWTPPGDYEGTTTVFDVLWSDLEPTEADDWDLDELRGFRTYLLTVRALPFGRSPNETVVAALSTSASPTTVMISDGTSATGWTSPDGAVTSASGRLAVPKHASPFDTQTDSFGNTLRGFVYDARLAQAAVDYTATPYLTLEIDVTNRASQFQIPIPKVFADGVECPLLTSEIQAPPDPAWVSAPRRCTYLVDDASVSEIRIVGETWTANSLSGDVSIDNVSRSNMAPAITSRMSLRTVTVGGSARTQASLLVEHATSPLGRTVVYTSPNLSAASAGVAVGGYSPPLDRYRTSGGTGTTDASTLSGSRKDGSVSGQLPEFAVPAARLPKGGYLLFLRARSLSGTITPTLQWAAATKVGSTSLGQQTGLSAPLTMTTDWTLIPVGGMVLPPTDVSDNSAASVTISVSTALGSSGWEWDEGLLFYMGEGAALTIVDAGSGSLALGSAHNSLWIESPTLDHPAPRVLLGVNGDVTTSFHAGEKAQAWGVHQFLPGEMSIFVATAGATSPEVSLRYHKRWHTHAAEAE